MYGRPVGKKQRKERVWLAVTGAGVVFLGAGVAVVAVVGLVDAFSGGTSPGFVGGSIWAAAAVAVIALGVWIIRRSGVAVGDALNW